MAKKNVYRHEVKIVGTLTLKNKEPEKFAEDFMVWVYDPKDSTLWSISKKGIPNDLKRKTEYGTKVALMIIKALKNVYNGQDPKDVLSSFELQNPCGESDVNYPPPYKGRAMSMEGIRAIEREILRNLEI